MERENILTGIKLVSNTSTTNSKQPLKESSKENEDFLTIKDNNVVIRNKHNYKLFKFDCCLGKYENQNNLYDNFCLTTVEDFVEGYDSTLIICGNSTTSNSYNDILLGKDTEEAKGLIPRFIDHMATSITYFSQRKFIFKVSFLEINNEEIIDLLGVRKCKLEIKQDKTHKNSFFVHNLEMKTLQKIDEIESFYLVGNRKREYAYSKQFRKRENSTSFFTVYLESVEEGNTIYRHSRYVFCELSGSSFEKFKNPTSEKNFHQSMASMRSVGMDRQNIFDLSNYSFQNVVNTIVYGEESTYVPFSDSKVTKLLSEALGGNMKTTILGLIEADSLAEIDKTFEILKTLQVASQIENTPSNLKEKSLSNRGLGIIEFLQEIHSLSNEIEKLKVELEILINNEEYVLKEVEKIVHQNDPSMMKENEFCSEEHIEDHFLEEKTKKEWELKQEIKAKEKILKEKISCVQNFKHLNNQERQNQQNSYLNEEKTISKRKEILLRVKAVKEKRLNSIPNSETEQYEREKKRETFALEIEFQKERNLFTSNIRELEEKLSFYKQIAESYLKKEEIAMIRTNCKYDETRRVFELPMFMVKDRKGKAYNGQESVSSERKFIVSPRSKSFNSYHSSKSVKHSVNKGLSFQKKMENILARKHRPSDEYKLEDVMKSGREVVSNNGSLRNIVGVKSNGKGNGIMGERASMMMSPISIERRNLMARMGSGNVYGSSNYGNVNNKAEMSEYTKKVKKEYELGPSIDMNRVKKYNEERVKLKEKESQNSKSKASKNKSYEGSPFFMRNKIRLQTEPVTNQGEHHSKAVSPVRSQERINTIEIPEYKSNKFS